MDDNRISQVDSKNTIHSFDLLQLPSRIVLNDLDFKIKDISPNTMLILTWSYN